MGSTEGGGGLDPGTRFLQRCDGKTRAKGTEGFGRRVDGVTGMRSGGWGVEVGGNKRQDGQMGKDQREEGVGDGPDETEELE